MSEKHSQRLAAQPRRLVSESTTMDSVVLETSLGDVQLELYWDHAPRVSHASGI